jgi:crotonobetaine/carnitine-CoA ligase
MNGGQRPSASGVLGLLERHAATRPGQPFLVTDDRVVDWATMREDALTVASGLVGLGVRPGNTVLLALDNSVEFVQAWFGVAVAGAVEVPVNPDMLGDRLLNVVNHSQARVAVVTPSMAARLDAFGDALAHLKLVVVVGDAPGRDAIGFEDLRADVSTFVPVRRNPDDLSAILYTSGSTGLPKGVMVPYGQHYANAAQARAASGLAPTDVIYLCLPLHHNMAQGYGIWPALRTGCTVRLATKFRRATFWDDVRHSGSTVWPFVGGLLALLAAQPPRGDDRRNPLRVAYGVPIPAALHRSFEERFGLRLVHGYGSTEATIPVWSDPDCPPGATGRVVPGYEVTVQDGDGHVVDGIGEICVRAARPSTMFAGYYRDPQRTDAAWRDGWFRTGDRGEFDARERLWFRGRAGDAIRRFGEFVDAEEVENAVLDLPGVVEAACFAVADDVAGQEVALAVVGSAVGSPSPAEIRHHLIDRIPGYALPRYVEVVAELPKTETGKVRRYELRDRGVVPAMQDFRATASPDAARHDRERQTSP